MELLDLLDWLCQQVRRSGRPMGGIQLVLVGDVCQLPPVYANSETRFFFQSAAWDRLDVQPVILTKVGRTGCCCALTRAAEPSASQRKRGVP